VRQVQTRPRAERHGERVGEQVGGVGAEIGREDDPAQGFGVRVQGHLAGPLRTAAGTGAEARPAIHDPEEDLDMVKITYCGS
jgi:hypothetical protein